VSTVQLAILSDVCLSECLENTAAAFRLHVSIYNHSFRNRFFIIITIIFIICKESQKETMSRV
jgi:hypothetical protein